MATTNEPPVAMTTPNEHSYTMPTTDEPSTSANSMSISSDETTNTTVQKKTVHDFNVFLSTFTSDEGTPFTNGFAMQTWTTLGRKNERTTKKLLPIIKEKGMHCSKSGLVYRLKLLQRAVLTSKKNITLEWTRITDMMNEMFTLPKKRIRPGMDEATDTSAEVDDFADDDDLTDEFLNSFFRRKDRKYAPRSSTLALRDFDSSPLGVCDIDSATVDYKFSGSSSGNVSPSEDPMSAVSDACSYLDEYSDNAVSDEFFDSFFRRNDVTDSSTLDLHGGVSSAGLDNYTDGASAVANITAEVPVDSSPKLDELTDNAQELNSFTELSPRVDYTDSPTYSRVDSTIDYKTDGSSTVKDCTTEDPTSKYSPGTTCRIF